jgi:tetratricopeptide (TPR) repeat protein
MPPPQADSGFPRLSFACVAVPMLALLLCFTVFKVHDNDIGYHIAKGRFFVENGRLVPAGYFLCSDYRGLDFLDRWGFQVVVYIVYAFWDLHGLLMLRILLVGCSLGILFFVRLPGSEGRLWLWRGVVLVLAMLVCYERFSLRGELFYYFFTLVYVVALVHHAGGGRAVEILLLPLLQIVWANMHGTFVFGVAIIGLFLFVEALKEVWCRVCGGKGERTEQGTRHKDGSNAGRPPRENQGAPSGDLRRSKNSYALTASFVLSLLACFLNPRGLTGVLLPIQMFIRLARVPWYQESVAEFVPTFGRYEQFTAVAIPALVVLMAVAGVFFLLNIRRTGLAQVLMLAFMVYLSVMGRRNIAFFGLVGSLFLIRDGEMVFGAIRKWLAGRGRQGILRTISVVGRALLWLAALALCFVLVTDRLAVRERSLREFGFGLSRAAYPIGAVGFLDSLNFEGNIFTNWDAGSYVLWKLFPRCIPYIDSEGDFSLELLLTYRRTMSGALPYGPEVDRLEVDAFLLRHRSDDTRSLVAKLWRDPQWSLVYWDDVSVVFLRNNERLKALGVDAIGMADGQKEFSTGLALFAAIDRKNEVDLRTRASWWDRSFYAGRAFRIAQDHLHLAGLMAAFGYPDLERAELLSALEWCADYPEALNNLGANYAQAGDIGQAKKLFQRALEEEPDYISAIRNLGTAYLQEQNYTKAIEEYTRGVAINPRDFVLPNLLAKAYVVRGGAGDLENALSVLQEAVEADGGNIGAHELLAALYESPDLRFDPVRAAFHRAEAAKVREAAYSLPTLPE